MVTSVSAVTGMLLRLISANEILNRSIPFMPGARKISMRPHQTSGKNTKATCEESEDREYISAIRYGAKA